MRKYWAFTRANLQNTFAYRGPMFIWLLGDLLVVLSMIAIWNSSAAKGLIGGYSRSELVTYYIIAHFLQWIILWYPFSGLFHQIKDGDIVLSVLSKPISCYFNWFFMDVGWHLISSIVGLTTSLVLAYYFKGNLSFSVSFVNLLLFFPAVVLGILICFTLSLDMGLLAFWFTEVGALESFFWMGRSLFGGASLPVSFIPGYFQFLVKILPFRYLFSLPMEILLGKLTLGETVWGFIIACLWLMVFLLIYRWLWNRGRKTYSAFGQ
jgi:ABC-2 type transport system permease protein